MTILKIIFWLSLFIILYTYLLYGIVLWVYLKLFGNRTIRPDIKDNHPHVSILVACYNEEAFIKQKIENLIAVGYPENKLELAFVTDGSDDDTVMIIQKAISDGVKITHFHENERKGKQHAVDRVIHQLKGNIIIFNDCNTIINPESISKMVRHFANEEVGVVSGEKKIKVLRKDIAVSSGEGLYWKYESWLKSLDSNFSSAIGAAGELYAIRKELYEHVPKHISIEDFYLSMRIASKGYKNIYEPEAWAEEYSSYNLSEELKRKRRIAVGNFNTLISLKSVFRLSNWRLIFLYFSHRILRWAVAPFCLLLLLLTSLIINQGLYELMLYTQLCFYLIALTGWVLSGIRTKYSIVYAPFYFCFMNYALLLGFYDFIRKDNKVVWEKVQRREMNQ